MEESNETLKVHFQCCTNCSSHSWCTRHDQSKYQSVFVSIKSAINTHLPDLEICYNQLPENYIPLRKDTSTNDNRYIDTLTKKSVYFPGLGSFEIHFNNILIFSKYESERWPEPMQIVNLLQQVQEEYNSAGNLKKYQMFEVRQDTLTRAIEDQERMVRLEEKGKKESFGDIALSLAQFERHRSGSLSKKRQFGSRAYNKIFRQVQQQLEEKEVRNVQELCLDPDIELSQRQNKYKFAETDSPRRISATPSSHKFIFTSHGATAYSGFTEKNSSKTKKSKEVQKDDLAQLMEERETFYKRKYKPQVSLTDHYWMYKSNSKKSLRSQLQQQNFEKIKSLKKDITKLNSTNNQKISELSQLNSQMHPLIKNNQYNELLMKMPQFIKKKASQQLNEKELIIKLDDIEEEHTQLLDELHKNDRRTPYVIMNEWDRELEMLETRFEKFEKKVEVMKQKKKEFENGSNLEKKFEELIQGDNKSNSLEKEYLMLLKNQSKENRGSKNMKDYTGISPQQRSEKLKRIYGRWKSKQMVKGNYDPAQARRCDDVCSEQDEQESAFSHPGMGSMRGMTYGDFSQKRQFQFKHCSSTQKVAKANRNPSQSKYHMNCHHHIPEAYFNLGKSKNDQCKTKRMTQQKLIQSNGCFNVRDKSKQQLKSSHHSIQKSTDACPMASFHQKKESRIDHYHSGVKQNKQIRNNDSNHKQKYSPGRSCTDSFQNRNSISGCTPSKVGSLTATNYHQKIGKTNGRGMQNHHHQEEDNQHQQEASLGPSRKESQDDSVENNEEQNYQESDGTITKEMMKYKNQKMKNLLDKNNLKRKQKATISKQKISSNDQKIPKQNNQVLQKQAIGKQFKSKSPKNGLTHTKNDSTTEQNKNIDSQNKNSKSKDIIENVQKNSNSNLHQSKQRVSQAAKSRVNKIEAKEKQTDRNSKSQTSRDKLFETTNRSVSKHRNESIISNRNKDSSGVPPSGRNSKDSKAISRSNDRIKEQSRDKSESKLAKKQFKTNIKLEEANYSSHKFNSKLQQSHSDVEEEEEDDLESSVQDDANAKPQINIDSNKKSGHDLKLNSSITKKQKSFTSKNKIQKKNKTQDINKKKNYKNDQVQNQIKQTTISKNEANISISHSNSELKVDLSKQLQSQQNSNLNLKTKSLMSQTSKQKSKLSIRDRSNITKKDEKNKSKLSLVSNSKITSVNKVSQNKINLHEKQQHQNKDVRRLFKESNEQSKLEQQQLLLDQRKEHQTSGKQEQPNNLQQNRLLKMQQSGANDEQNQSTSHQQSVKKQRQKRNKPNKVNKQDESNQEREEQINNNNSQDQVQCSEQQEEEEVANILAHKSSKKASRNKMFKNEGDQLTGTNKQMSEEDGSSGVNEQQQRQIAHQIRNGQKQKTSKTKKQGKNKNKLKTVAGQINSSINKPDQQNCSKVLIANNITNDINKNDHKQNQQNISKQVQQEENKDCFEQQQNTGEGSAQKKQNIRSTNNSTAKESNVNGEQQQEVLQENNQHISEKKEDEIKQIQIAADSNIPIEHIEENYQQKRELENEKQLESIQKSEKSVKIQPIVNNSQDAIQNHQIDKPSLKNKDENQTSNNNVEKLQQNSNNREADSDNFTNCRLQNQCQIQNNNQNTVPSNQQNTQSQNYEICKGKIKQYTGPTNIDMEENGQQMIGRETSISTTPKSRKDVQFKQVGVQNYGVNDVSSQTHDTHPLSEINNLSKINQNVFKSTDNKESHHQNSQIQKENTYQRKLDIKRANILNNIYFENTQIFKLFPRAVVDHENKQYVDKSFPSSVALRGIDGCSWMSLRKIFKDSMLFPEDKKWSVGDLTIEDKKNKSLCTVMKMLISRRPHLISRLFENSSISKNGLYGVWLCHNSAWTPVIVDDYIPFIENSETPVFLNSPNFIWPYILEKSISKIVGGYKNFELLTVPDIFKLLTGSNFVTFKIKQDPSMNSKAIRYVSENENKNFILHCEKHKKQVPNSSLVKIPEVLTIQSAQNIDQKDLIQLKIDEGEPFWMKFQIFCQTFKCINLLHLRQTYLFTHIPVNLYPSSYTVVELSVQGATSAEVSLCHLGDEDQLPKTTRVILYREEEKSILKLVGQAKQKNKKLIFFDCQLRKGRYFLFIEGEKNYSDAILSYSGEERAQMRIIENIENQTMKNKKNEYIPISKENKAREKEKEAPKYMNNIFEFGAGRDRHSDRISDNSEKLEKIKSQFLEYLANEK